MTHTAHRARNLWPRRLALLRGCVFRLLRCAQVVVSDVSDQTVQLRLAGPQSDSLVKALGAGELVGRAAGSHAVYGAGREPVVISVSSGFSTQGYTVIASEGAAADFWQRCIKQVRCALTHPLMRACDMTPAHRYKGGLDYADTITIRQLS